MGVLEAVQDHFVDELAERAQAIGARLVAKIDVTGDLRALRPGETRGVLANPFKEIRGAAVVHRIAERAVEAADGVDPAGRVAERGTDFGFGEHSALGQASSLEP